MTTENEKYIKGFNHGYYLKKNNPGLLKSILQSKSYNDYFKGLTDASRTLEVSKVKQRLNELSKNNLSKDIER